MGKLILGQHAQPPPHQIPIQYPCQLASQGNPLLYFTGDNGTLKASAEMLHCPEILQCIRTYHLSDMASPSHPKVCFYWAQGNKA